MPAQNPDPSADILIPHEDGSAVIAGPELSWLISAEVVYTHHTRLNPPAIYAGLTGMQRHSKGTRDIQRIQMYGSQEISHGHFQ